MNKEFYEKNPGYDELKPYFIEEWEIINKLSIQEIIANSPKSVLDIGFGTGDLLFDVANKLPPTSKIIAIEPNVGMFKSAKNKYNFPKNVELILQNIEEFAGKEKFDVVSICLVYHNLSRELRDLKKITNLVKSNGKLIITDFVTRKSREIFLKERKLAQQKALINGVSKEVAQAIYEQEISDKTITREKLERLLVANKFTNIRKFYDIGSYVGYCAQLKPNFSRNFESPVTL